MARLMFDTRHIGRNDPCPCGSGMKFKKCCLNKPYTPSEWLANDLALGQRLIQESGMVYKEKSIKSLDATRLVFAFDN